MTLKKFIKGFTLIELLIVIAIIGILSSVVLASLNTARGKGANATIKADIHGLRAQAEIIYDNNGADYTSVCADAGIRAALDNAVAASGSLPADGECNSDNANWAATAPLKMPDDNGFTYWCLDLNGIPKGEMAPLGSATSCL